MWTIIFTLIGIGLLIVLLEILVIPGGGVAGVIGLALMVSGVYLAFEREGTTAGMIVLSGTVVLNIVALVLALRSKTWDRAMLHTNLEGRVNVVEAGAVRAGDEGTTISRCAPLGKAFINNEFYEVDARTEFIDENKTIEVIRVEGNKIIIKLKTLYNE